MSFIPGMVGLRGQEIDNISVVEQMFKEMHKECKSDSARWLEQSELVLPLVVEKEIKSYCQLAIQQAQDIWGMSVTQTRDVKKWAGKEVCPREEVICQWCDSNLEKIIQRIEQNEEEYLGIWSDSKDTGLLAELVEENWNITSDFLITSYEKTSYLAYDYSKEKGNSGLPISRTLDVVSNLRKDESSLEPSCIIESREALDELYEISKGVLKNNCKYEIDSKTGGYYTLGDLKEVTDRVKDFAKDINDASFGQVEFVKENIDINSVNEVVICNLGKVSDVHESNFIEVLRELDNKFAKVNKFNEENELFTAEEFKNFIKVNYGVLSKYLENDYTAIASQLKKDNSERIPIFIKEETNSSISKTAKTKGNTPKERDIR